jgi:hypothetical protein
MCDCTPKTPARYCGQPGCRDPRDVEIEQLRQTLKLQQASYEREREIDETELDRWRDTVAHVVTELEALDDETAQAQCATLRQLLGVA